MAKAFLIMCENTPVISINFDVATYDILCEELLPFTLKGRLRKVPTYEEMLIEQKEWIESHKELYPHYL